MRSLLAHFGKCHNSEVAKLSAKLDRHICTSINIVPFSFSGTLSGFSPEIMPPTVHAHMHTYKPIHTYICIYMPSEIFANFYLRLPISQSLSLSVSQSVRQSAVWFIWKERYLLLLLLNLGLSLCGWLARRFSKCTLNMQQQQIKAAMSINYNNLNKL